MNAQEFITKVNFMISVGTDFNYKQAYTTLSDEDKKIVDDYFESIEFTLS